MLIERLTQAGNQSPLLKLNRLLTVLYLTKILQQKSVLLPHKENLNTYIQKVFQCCKAEVPDFWVNSAPSDCFESQRDLNLQYLGDYTIQTEWQGMGGGAVDQLIFIPLYVDKDFRSDNKIN